MSAIKVLAAALERTGHPSKHEPLDLYASDVISGSPTLAQDMDDGRALRELREAVPASSGTFIQVFSPYLDGSDDVWDVSVIGDGTDPSWRGTGPTIAAAADACRMALEERP